MRPPAGDELRLGESPGWLLGAILAVAFAAFFFSFSAAQITGPTAGKRIQARAVALVTDVDELLPAIYPEWKEEALTASGASLPVPYFPLPVRLDKRDITGLPIEDLRGLVLAGAGDRVYNQGWEALAVEGASQPGRFSPGGLVRGGLGLVSDEMYALFRLLTIFFALGALALTIVVVKRRNASEGIAVFGVAALSAALASLVAALLFMFILRSLSDGQEDVFASGLFDLGGDIIGIPIRNNVIFFISALAVIAISTALARIGALARGVGLAAQAEE